MGKILSIHETVIRLFILFLILVSLPVVITAATDVAGNTLAEHTDVLTWLIGGLLVVISFFITRTLLKIDRNQNRLFNRLDELSREFYILQGEHNTRSGNCGSGKLNRRKDDSK